MFKGGRLFSLLSGEKKELPCVNTRLGKGNRPKGEGGPPGCLGGSFPFNVFSYWGEISALKAKLCYESHAGGAGKGESIKKRSRGRGRGNEEGDRPGRSPCPELEGNSCLL